MAEGCTLQVFVSSTSVGVQMNFRTTLQLLCCAVLVSVGAVRAQTPASQTVRYAVVSAVGDQLTVVYARLQTGSRLDRNYHDVTALPDNTLDRLVLRNVDAVVKRTGGAEVAALAAANKSLFTAQKDGLTGKQSSDAAVKAFAAALPPGGADRLLLVLKHRAEARIPIREGVIGLGRLEGVGFYVDSETYLKSATTGNVGQGFLAPFAYVRLVLADAEGRIIDERRVEAARSFSIGDARDALQPWEVLNADAKVAVLDQLLKAEIEKALPGLLATK